MGKGSIPEINFQEESLVDKLGGDNQYEFLILSYCENILDDSNLAKFYKEYDIDSLASLQKSLLDIAFQHHDKISTEDIRNRFVLQNYSLIENGFLNVDHFEMLREHFVSALHDCWIEDELFELCQRQFDEIRAIFAQQGKDMEQTFIERRVMELRILSACA
eukprot:scaffold23506_cov93-Cylindrotheca_fusiformis.AAC.4